MTVEDHIKLIDNAVVLEVEEQDGAVLYHGFKGCFEHCEDKRIQKEEVTRFRIRCDGKRRTNKNDRETITELNSGIFNYCDLHIELVYVYTIKKTR